MFTASAQMVRSKVTTRKPEIMFMGIAVSAAALTHMIRRQINMCTAIVTASSCDVRPQCTIQQTFRVDAKKRIGFVRHYELNCENIKIPYNNYIKFPP